MRVEMHWALASVRRDFAGSRVESRQQIKPIEKRLHPPGTRALCLAVPPGLIKIAFPGQSSSTCGRITTPTGIVLVRHGDSWDNQLSEGILALIASGVFSHSPTSLTHLPPKHVPFIAVKSIDGDTITDFGQDVKSFVDFV